jgi:hypothetical protein
MSHLKRIVSSAGNLPRGCVLSACTNQTDRGLCVINTPRITPMWITVSRCRWSTHLGSGCAVILDRLSHPTDFILVVEVRVYPNVILGEKVVGIVAEGNLVKTIS